MLQKHKHSLINKEGICLHCKCNLETTWTVESEPLQIQLIEHIISMKVLWVVKQYALLGGYKCFAGIYFDHHQG